MRLLPRLPFLPPPVPRRNWLRLLPQPNTLGLRFDLSKLVLSTLLARLLFGVIHARRTRLSLVFRPLEPTENALTPDASLKLGTVIRLAVVWRPETEWRFHLWRRSFFESISLKGDTGIP